LVTSCLRDALVKASSHFVTAEAFYPLLLTVSRKVGVHFHPAGCQPLLGALYSALAVSAPTLYGGVRCYTNAYLGISMAESISSTLEKSL